MKIPLLLLICVSVFNRINCRVATFETNVNSSSNLVNINDIGVKPLKPRTYIAHEHLINEVNRDKHNGFLKLPKIGQNCSTVDNNVDEITMVLNGPCNPTKQTPRTPALILTPYIEDGRMEEGRSSSKVDPDLFLGVPSYSGFFTVNKTYNSNMFFWYFPVAEKEIKETPWIIWLQGGPGASSLTGLFEEIGPFKVDNNFSLIRNSYSWNREYSLLFFDNPVGTGFSFTDHPDGYVQDMETYSKHLYSAFQQFLQIFPELRTAPLYIAGESYAGKYVPSLGYEIHHNMQRPGMDVNLKGFLVGNAYVDPDMLRNLINPYYYFGLVDKQQIKSIQPLLDGFEKDITDKNSVGAKNKFQDLIVTLMVLSNQDNAYNILRDDLSIGKFVRYLSKPVVREAIHVGNIKYDFINETVNFKMKPDFLSSAKYKFEALLEHYDVLTYCGHLDLMITCPATTANHLTWSWSQAESFRNATRLPWVINSKRLGYVKSGGRLTEVVVRGAGHMAVQDKPKPVLALLTRWIAGQNITEANEEWQSYVTNLYKIPKNPPNISNSSTVNL